MDERQKLALFLIVLSVFLAVFGKFFAELLDYMGSFGEFEVPERDRSPYLYKGDGEGQKYDPNQPGEPRYCEFCGRRTEGCDEEPDACRVCRRFYVELDDEGSETDEEIKTRSWWPSCSRPCPSVSGRSLAHSHWRGTCGSQGGWKPITADADEMYKALEALYDEPADHL